MGTFASLLGNRKIKEELKKEYCDNMQKLFKFGGMVQFEEVRILIKIFI